MTLRPRRPCWRRGLDPRAVRSARSALAAAALALAGCATASGPPAKAIARDVSAGGASALRGAQTVWLADAISRTGAVAAGLDQEASVPATHDAALRETLERSLRRMHGLELAPSRDAADLVLYFEQADRLRCFGCRQPENLWHWWGYVADRSGHELASLHGETEGGPDAAAQQFVRSVQSLARQAAPRGKGGAGR